MRVWTGRRAAPAALLALLVAGLAACSGETTVLPTAGSSAGASADASSGASASAAPSVDASADAAALATVTVSGASGAATITLPSTPFTLTGTSARMVSDGTGAALTKGQLMTTYLTAVSGKDGSVLGSQKEPFVVGGTNVTQLDSVLSGAHVGARVLLGLSGSPTEVYAVDVLSADDILSRAQGTAVAPVAGLPTVTLDSSGAPSVQISGTKPTTLVAQDLITGSGATVASGDTVTVHYTGWLWDGGTQFDSSWTKGVPFSFTVGSSQVITGWSTGLVGKTVGSQVLLVLPPDDGYGSTGSGKTIPANATLVFVVDILDARKIS